MIIAKVVGSAVATLKHSLLEGTKLLLICQADTAGNIIGQPLVAVDVVGAGEGELVIVTQGSSARMAVSQSSSPVDAAIIGILDSLQVEGKTAFRKG
jgi:microcompartment protein CcmK/EutM